MIFHYTMTLFWLTISYSGHMVAWLSQKVVGLIPRPIGGRAECEWLFVFLCDTLASVPGLNLIRQSWLGVKFTLWSTCFWWFAWGEILLLNKITPGWFDYCRYSLLVPRTLSSDKVAAFCCLQANVANPLQTDCRVSASWSCSHFWFPPKQNFSCCRFILRLLGRWKDFTWKDFHKRCVSFLGETEVVVTRRSSPSRSCLQSPLGFLRPAEERKVKLRTAL